MKALNVNRGYLLKVMGVVALTFGCASAAHSALNEKYCLSSGKLASALARARDRGVTYKDMKAQLSKAPSNSQEEREMGFMMLKTVYVDSPEITPDQVEMFFYGACMQTKSKMEAGN
ncbi:hypothetical protein [Rhodoferax sp. GW822-FHT02A01]|uniref:hypothetical protein n=1 Tax=Rhodoferax sp. GW822-FHT02A01 TaxID=3141537 RepID=UPI00315D2E41